MVILFKFTEQTYFSSDNFMWYGTHCNTCLVWDHEKCRSGAQFKSNTESLQASILTSLNARFDAREKKQLNALKW